MFRTMNNGTLLKIGTSVRVGTKRGIVTAAKMVEAHNGGMIPLHTVRFTESFKRGFGRNGTWQALAKQTESQVNYSFIQTLE